MHDSIATPLLAAVLTTSLCGLAHADDKSTKQSALLDKTIAIAAEEDTFQAIAFLERQGVSTVVADHYSQLLRTLYFEKKDVPLMVTFGRAGINYALAQARIAEAMDAETANKLKAIAKTIAFNLGANTWPGWNDAGIVIDRSNKQAGLDAARLNLRLAIELKRNDDVMANALWLHGAQLLAANQPQSAVKAFRDAAEKFRVAKKPESVLMAEGYIGIARMTVDSTRDAGKKELQDALKSLVEHGSQDAKFFAEQLETAAKVFSK